MNPKSRLFAASVLVAASLPAQDPADTVGADRLAPVRPQAASIEVQPVGPVTPAPAMPKLRTPIHTAEADLGLAYGTWAAGDNYKVSFHDGMAFVPYLGVGYPTTQTLAWRTTSAKVGEVELVEGAPGHHQADFRYEYRFGAITEAYDVLGEGLEQTFVLNQRPAAGDLVIRGAVKSLLKSRNVAPAVQGLTFVDTDGHAIVEYGRAVAFDANGQRVDVTTAHNDGVVTLTVPGGWLESAALPIVVDPLLTRVQLATWGAATFGTVGTVDICRDDEATTGNVMVAYTRNASATDADLWLRLCNDDFSSDVLVYSDITTTWDTDQANCCFVGGANRFVAVMRRFFSTLTPTQSRVRCKLHDSGSTTLTTNVGNLAGVAGINDWRVDVGGVQGFAAGNNAYVVFQQEDNGAGNNFANSTNSRVMGTLIDATTANGTFGTPVNLEVSATYDSERPSVSQSASGGTTFSWACVFQRYLSGSTTEDWDLNGKLIAQDGSVSTGTFISDLATGGPLTHQLGPVVEGSNGRYAVVFSAVDQASVAFQTTLISGKELYIERFDWANGAASPTGNYPPVLLRSNTDRRWEATGLGYDTDTRSHWTCGFRAVAPGVPALYYTRVGYNGEITEGPGTLLYFVAGETPVAGNCTFDNDNDTFLFGYGVDDNTTTLPVYGHAVTYDVPAAQSNFGTSCSTATLNWLGSQQIGSQFGRVQVAAAPATAIHFLVLAISTVNVPVLNPPVFPGCRLFVPAAGPDYLGYFPPQIGVQTFYDLPLPPFLTNQTLHFQDWYLDGSFLYSTERLSVPIVK